MSLLLPVSLLPVLGLRNSLKEMNSDGWRAHIICLPSVNNHILHDWCPLSSKPGHHIFHSQTNMMSYDLVPEVILHDFHNTLRMRKLPPPTCVLGKGCQERPKGLNDPEVKDHYRLVTIHKTWVNILTGGVGKLDWMGRVKPNESTSEWVLTEIIPFYFVFYKHLCLNWTFITLFHYYLSASLFY